MPTPFSFSGSFGSTKTSGSETYNRNGSTTATLPDWAKQPAMDLMGGIQGLFNTDPNSLVPGANGYQTHAIDSVNKLSGSPWNFDTAADWTRQVGASDAPQMQAASGKAASVLDGLDGYFSPYQKDVIDSSAADFDFNAGQDRARETLGMAGNGAFGGSGAALTRSAGDDARGRARFSLLSGLRDQGFQRAAALSADDANRRQQASFANAGFTQQANATNAGLQDTNLTRRLAAGQNLAGISTMFDQNARDNATAEFGMGDTLRGYDAARATAPFDMYQYLTNLWGGIATPFFGQDTTENGTSQTKGKSTSFGLKAGIG